MSLTLRVVYAAQAELLLGSQETALAGAHRSDFVEPFWAILASTLTKLKLRYGHEIGPATTSALCQLTRLRHLSLDGVSTPEDNDGAIAHVTLSLPWLQKLTIADFSHVKLSLDCPRLKDLQLIGLHPLEALDGLPRGIERVKCRDLAEGSLSIADIFQGHKLELLKDLDIDRESEAFEDPEAVKVLKRWLRNSMLTSFCAACPLEKLVPLGGPHCELPNSLQYLWVHVPLNKGIPVVLEQLTNLRSLSIMSTTREGLMHLDRPLDPFLDMVHLEVLNLQGQYWSADQVHSAISWTLDGLRLLGLASRRILQGNLLPPGRKLALTY